MKIQNLPNCKRKVTWISVSSGIFLLLTMMVLTGCYGGAVKEEIWLKGNERWESEITLTLTAEEREIFESQIGDWENLIESNAVEDVSFRVREYEEPDGGISYVVKMSGRGLGIMNTQCFDGQARIRQDDEGNVSISWTPDSQYTYVLREMTVVIHGGEIISSNANTIEHGVATWHNPTHVEVTVAEGGFPIVGILVIGMGFLFLLGFVVFGGIGFLLLLRKQQTKTSTS